MQNAYASYQSTQSMGSCSLTSGASVHDAYAAASHARTVFHAVRSPGRTVFHPLRHPPSCKPEPVLSTTPRPLARWVWMPSPEWGLQPATHASTKRRKRPTLTSYLSRAKELTVAGFPASRLRTPSKLRAYVPPSTIG